VSRHGRHRDLRVILTGGAVLLAADVAVWAAWHLWPLLLLAAAGVLAWRWRKRNQHRPPVVQGQVVSDADQLRAKVARLETAANRPIDAIIANYERIGRQYGPAAVGKAGRQQ
jgi:hypothetical protein